MLDPSDLQDFLGKKEQPSPERDYAGKDTFLAKAAKDWLNLEAASAALGKQKKLLKRSILAALGGNIPPGGELEHQAEDMHLTVQIPEKVIWDTPQIIDLLEDARTAHKDNPELLGQIDAVLQQAQPKVSPDAVHVLPDTLRQLIEALRTIKAGTAKLTVTQQDEDDSDS